MSRSSKARRSIMPNQTHTILVVDDEPISLMKLAKLLGDKYRTVTANSGQEALEILKRDDTVSLVITDQQMPGMSGIELLRACHSVNPDIIYMLMSAVNDVGTFIDAVTKSGAVRVINKPWDSKKLLEDIESSLDRYEKLLANKSSIDRLRRAQESLDRTLKE
jgi:DNA-binding NtrC family response regulator